MVAGVYCLASISIHLGRSGRVAVGVVAAVQILMGIGASSQTLSRARTSLTAAARARQTAEEKIPLGSVVILDRQLAESLDATGQWKLVEESLIARGGPGPDGPRFAGRRGPLLDGPFPPPGLGEGEAESDVPSPQQVGKNRAQRERYAGLSPVMRRERVWADVATWAAGKPVFWFARSVDVVEANLPAGADFESIAEIDAPSMLGPGRPMGNGPLARAPGGGLPQRAEGPDWDAVLLEAGWAHAG